MEGDAGTSRLNPTGGQERSDPGGVSGGQERSDPGNVSGGQERSDPGGDSPPEPDTSDAQSEEEQDQLVEAVTEAEARADVDTEPTADGVVERRPERFGRGWLVAICLALAVATAGVAVGGYFAHRSHAQSEASPQRTRSPLSAPRSASPQRRLRTSPP